MKVKIIKESKLLQEKVEIKTEQVQDTPRTYKVIFTINTDELTVKQMLTIRRSSPGTAPEIFDAQLPKVQKCFPKPPEKTYRGDTLDPIHQLQIDYGYVIQEPEHATNTMGQKIYSHDKNVWLLGDKTYLGPDIYSIDFHVLEINGQGPVSPGQEYDTNPFNNFSVSMAFFRKLTQLIGEYVARYPYRFYYFFGTTESGEPYDLPSKRTRLYNTMLRKLYKELGGNWVQFEEVYENESDPNSIFFFKCPGGAVTESKKRKFYLTTKDKKIIQEALIDEAKKWSEKYKKSINCKNPKGFSQKAHCAGRKKNEQQELEEKCQKGYKTHKTRKTKIMFGKRYRNCVKAEEGKDPAKGTGKKPKGSGRRLYTDENPSDTVSVKFASVQDIKDTLSKKSFKSKSHKRQSQIINLIHQRSRAAYKNAKDPKVKARLKKAFNYATKRKEASKKKTQRMRKQKNESK